MTGYERIAEERSRQIHEEGWTPEHDDTHADGELARAAGAYCMRAGGWWPWTDSRPKFAVSIGWPSTQGRIRELEKAGALIAAEIDRLHRTIT